MPEVGAKMVQGVEKIPGVAAPPDPYTFRAYALALTSEVWSSNRRPTKSIASISIFFVKLKKKNFAFK